MLHMNSGYNIWLLLRFAIFIVNRVTSNMPISKGDKIAYLLPIKILENVLRTVYIIILTIRIHTFIYHLIGITCIFNLLLFLPAAVKYNSQQEHYKATKQNKH